MLEKLTNWLLTPITKLFEWLNEFVEWIYNFFRDLPAFVFDWFADGIISFFNAMPVPSFFSQAGSAFSGLSSGTVYFLDAFALDMGIPIVLGAYLLRFILRRIPFIG